MKSFKEFITEKEPEYNISAKVADREMKLVMPGKTHEEREKNTVNYLRRIGYHSDDVHTINHLDKE